MMHTWFECKIRYERVMENGMNKKVTEPYLVDALSFTEAEARIIEEMTPFISGEFTISDIKRANYSELFPSDEASADRWFKCKLFFITLDDKSGAEKKTRHKYWYRLPDLRDAVKKLDEGMKGTMQIIKLHLFPKPLSWMFTRILPKNPLQIPSAKMPTPLLYAISSNHFLKVVRQQ